MSSIRKITPTMAAQLMEKGVLFVYEGMKRGVLEIGTAMQMPGSTKWNFYISPPMLASYLGVGIEELWKAVDELEQENSKCVSRNREKKYETV